MTNKVVDVKAATESIGQILEKDAKEVGDLLIPLLREYLNDMRAIRMALSSETVNILRSMEELSKAAAKINELKDFLDTLIKLQKLMTPEFMELIGKLTK